MSLCCVLKPLTKQFHNFMLWLSLIIQKQEKTFMQHWLMTSKSSHYKIVHFQGFIVLDIFHSKSRDWITLTYQLEGHVVKAY